MNGKTTFILFYILKLIVIPNIHTKNKENRSVGFGVDLGVYMGPKKWFWAHSLPVCLKPLMFGMGINSG